jgi:menaquinone-dependent protoporphyrinogen IX oxidase
VTIAAVAGGLNYPAYPRGFRFAMRLAALVLRLPTDTSRVHELTDWAAVETAANEFFSKLEVSETKRAGYMPTWSTE